jgi:hypothetical protein
MGRAAANEHFLRFTRSGQIRYLLEIKKRGEREGFNSLLFAPTRMNIEDND